MLLGKNGKWMWLTTPGITIAEVVRHCPQLVIDRFVQMEKSVLSPRIGNIDQLPAQSFGEWYIFLTSAEPAVSEFFVNHADFRLTEGHMGLFEMKAAEQELKFWEQLSAVGPHAFIAANENLIFCTDDGDLYESVAIAAEAIQWDLEAHLQPKQ